MNVKAVVETILQKCNVPPMEQTCDQLIVGDWNAEVTGIATTFMATVDVIKEAAAKGANLIITHEPTFFTGWDKTEWLKDDPVYTGKQDLIHQHQINIWRFHDHMHWSTPDLIYDGLIRELGWETYQNADDKHCFTIPRMSVVNLAEFLEERLQVSASRIVGAVNGSVERVGFLVGGGSLGLGREEMPMELMNRANLDAIVCGEIYEWTLAAYVHDAAQLGMNKSLIVLGHNRTEEVGMKYLVNWLQALFPKIPVDFIEAGDPFIYHVKPL